MALATPHIENQVLENSNEDRHQGQPERDELSMDAALLEKLKEVAESNLSNEQFSVEDLAGEVALSRSHLHRKLRKIAGVSISQFIRSIRLEHALDLLKKNVGTVGEIAFRVGFGSSTYFIKCFSESYGFSPGEVKRKVEEGFFEIQISPEGDQIEKPKKDSKPSPLELLHPSSSESVIREVFGAMVEHRSSLEKFLMVDEEEGETLDIRLLAYQIFKNYPWPIGVEIRRLFSVSMKDPNQERLNQLNKTIYACLQVLTFLGISELVRYLSQSKKDKKNIGIDQLITDLSEKNCVEVIRKLSEFCKNEDCDYFIEELRSVYDKAFLLELNDWLELNSSRAIQKEELKDTCSTLEEIAILILKKSSFLVRYKLVNVGSIQVRKNQFKSALFEHSLQLLNSTDSEFQVRQEVMDQYSDSNAVLLMKSIREPKDFLNLSPFMIDTHNEGIKANEQKQIKRDIYMLSKFEDGELVYGGTEVKFENDLSKLQNYDELVEEFEHIKGLIG